MYKYSFSLSLSLVSEFFLFARIVFYPLPPIQWIPGALSPEIKQPGREEDQSSSSRA
jgi:hypothetical protein